MMSRNVRSKASNACLFNIIWPSLIAIKLDMAKSDCKITLQVDSAIKANQILHRECPVLDPFNY